MISKNFTGRYILVTEKESDKHKRKQAKEKPNKEKGPLFDKYAFCFEYERFH